MMMVIGMEVLILHARAKIPKVVPELALVEVHGQKVKRVEGLLLCTRDGEREKKSVACIFTKLSKNGGDLWL